MVSFFIVMPPVGLPLFGGNHCKKILSFNTGSVISSISHIALISFAAKLFFPFTFRFRAFNPSDTVGYCSLMIWAIFRWDRPASAILPLRSDTFGMLAPPFLSLFGDRFSIAQCALYVNPFGDNLPLFNLRALKFGDTHAIINATKGGYR